MGRSGRNNEFGPGVQYHLSLSMRKGIRFSRLEAPCPLRTMMKPIGTDLILFLFMWESKVRLRLLVVECFISVPNTDLSNNTVVDVLRTDADGMECGQEVQEGSPVSMPATTTRSTQASILNADVDGIEVAENSLLISPPIETPFPACSHAATPCLPPSMRPPALSTVSPPSSPLHGNLPNRRPRPNHSRVLSIPPSPRGPPPHPPTVSAPPAYTSDYVMPVLEHCLPAAPKVAPPLPPFKIAPLTPPPSFSVSLSNREVPKESEVDLRHREEVPAISALNPPVLPPLFVPTPLQIKWPSLGHANLGPPPVIPPRSKLRPPPVKITTRSSGTTVTQNDDPKQADNIACLSMPPEPYLSMHSHSASIASVTSSFVISPMPSPPSFSPTTPPSTSSRSSLDSPSLTTLLVRPAGPEPPIDMGALMDLILQHSCGPNQSQESTEWASHFESGVGDSSETIAPHADDLDDARTADIPEFVWQEGPKSPPSLCESQERINTPGIGEDDEDDAASFYSQFSVAYSFPSRPKSPKNLRSVRRSQRRRRMSRRLTTTSMMSVYSQASFSSLDAADVSPMPSLPWDLRLDQIDDVSEELPAEIDLGVMTSNAPDYAYAYSLDENVDHGLDGVVLTGEGLLVEEEPEMTNNFDDWRNLLTARDKGKGKKRTSSNISVVGNVIVNVAEDSREANAETVFTDVGSVSVNRSIGDISTTSTLTPASPHPRVLTTWLVPNRRRKTIVHRLPSVLSSSSTISPSTAATYQSPSSPSVNSIFDSTALHPRWRRELFSESGDVDIPFPRLDPEDKMKRTRGVRLGLRVMRSRVSVLKSRLVSLALPPARIPVSPSYDCSLNSPLPANGLYPPALWETYASPPWSGLATSPSVSPSSSSAGSGRVGGGSGSGGTSPPSSASSFWTANGETFIISSAVKSSTTSDFPMAV
ncbi:hypothetical protein B0H10DRAFT_397047 [Mycena sp. CBHHK59/15]|nr:hypothetical protein B0H10DRAFT_397047 [Mycena sp. CBHHK59/15]